jgi:hypothetical protein
MASGLFTLKQQVQALRQGAWDGQKPKAVEYLVVAGGGGGGNNGGGAGAGGLLSGITPVSTGTAITVTVGAGGSGQTYANRSAITGGFNSVFGNITTTGGGQGGTESYSWGDGNGRGANGGSGGGGGFFAALVSGGQGVLGQGNAGGTNAGTNLNGYGGGGGAGAFGINSLSTTLSGNGGAGVASAISGTVTAYAGGGGGGQGAGGFGIGGVGGGGTGSATNGGNGTANTGGGGGGSPGGTSGNGGSGIVIVSYPDTYAAATSSTGSPTVSTSGSGSFYNAGAGSLGFSGTTPFNFGTGNFTIEGWYNLANFNNASAGGNPGLIGYGTANWLLVIPGGAYNFYVGGSVIASSSAVASINVWNHFAIVRSGTTFTIYHNGTSVGTGTSSASVSIGSSGLTVGSNGPSGIGSVTGYMTNVRVVKGVAVYTGNFTVPVSPLQVTQAAGTNIAAITGTDTSLLVNTVSGAYTADSSTNGAPANSNTTAISWNSASPFATGLGYKNRVYTWTSSGSITF